MRAVKDKRRELRLSDADESVLVEAAGLVGESVSEFLLARALHDAEAIVRRHRTIELDQYSHDALLAALDAPLPDDDAFAGQVRKANRLKHHD